MYGKCGSMADARKIFDRMQRPDVVSLTSLVLGYAENGEAQEALRLFQLMKGGCEPNARTFVAGLKACSSLAAREEAKKTMAIHSRAARAKHDSDNFIANTLVDAYAKCGSLPDSQRVFDRISRRDVVSWTALILGHAESDHPQVALELFSGLEDCYVNSLTFWDLFVANSLVDMYAKCGSMVDSRRVFDGMRRHDVVSWNSLISGYADNDQGEAALELFVPMELEGCAHDSRTFLASLKACGCVGALDIGRTLHGKIRELGLDSDVVIATSLVDFYGKCGSMVDAEQVFSSIVTKDIVAWNALLTGYSRQGDTEALFQAFDRMMASRPRVRPDGVTFLCVLTACSHSGLVEQGKRYFEAMKSIHGLDPGMEHYHCLVDILGRSNRLEEAVAMVKEMPVVANIVSWTTVLSACQKWKNIEVAKVAFDALLELDEEQPAARVLMANIYGSVGMWDAKARVLQEA
ncbi:hypothetical protein SELMODRAFT_73641 [Selaginella moellendorffii]|uniref:Pentacotripeptide-repeat region of PRORP domain-containing protein n=1 Tax=Selaginella moellendorffii TaxID=88036 RepID=D8QP85_SELML|nr:hypothetical protein SELMODRAFT_73641 [Selaginella moellendorffii]